MESHQNLSLDPDTALAISRMESQTTQRVSSRLPELRISAYVLLGLVAFGIIQTFVLKQVAVSVLGAAGRGFAPLDPATVLSWLVCIAGGIILLITKRPVWAKFTIAIISINIALFTFSGLIHGDIIGSMLNVGALWWGYRLYRLLVD